MKILITATVLSHICQFHLPLIKSLKEQGHQVDVAARDNLNEKPGLKLEYADNFYNIPFERSPFSISNFKAFKQLKKIVDNNDYNIIHCNTPVGGIVTRLAGKNARKNGTKIIYTAHGFHFYEGAPLKNWLLYYTAEKLMVKYTDALITINTDDYELAKKKFGKTKVEYIHGVGFDRSRFHREEHSKEQLRDEFGIPQNATVIVSVGELNDNKNQIAVLKALNILNNKDFYYLVCGNGPNEEKLKKYVEENNIADNVRFLGYRRDLDTIFKMSDIFVHTALREGLPFVVLEAMECGLIPVCFNIRGVRDLVSDKTGMLVDVGDFYNLAEIFQKCLNVERSTDSINIITELYSVENTIKEILSVYSKV